MTTPTSQLQTLTNKSIIELFSVELKADLHYTKSAKTAMLFSRTNTLLSLPMLLSMVAAQNLY